MLYRPGPGLLLPILAAQGCTGLGGITDGERLMRIQRSPHYRRAAFQNPVQTTLMRPGALLSTLARWYTAGAEREPPSPPPVVRLSARSFAHPPPGGLRITWMGHSSLLVECDGQRVLTDPIWSRRSSPVSWAGPVRFMPPPLPLEALPPLDAVIISHDHYDHLDQTTVERLAATGVPFYVPLGIGAHLEHWGVPADRIVELDWWQEVRVAGGRLHLAATPARHFSGRRLLDRDKTLWAGWVIRGARHRVFFAGDTGTFDGLGTIGRRLGPFDATLLPIGAYDRAWQGIHLNPEEAVEAHRALRGRVLIPHHWGTFNLAFHPWNEPPRRLLARARESEVTVVVPRVGHQVDLARVPAVVRPWWLVRPARK